ncbi:hypothetical protein [Pseudomonas sp. ZL2]
MSERFSSIAAVQSADRADSKRKAAVIAALELVAAAVSNPINKAVLSDEISKLSGYADAIQEALKGK